MTTGKRKATKRLLEEVVKAFDGEQVSTETILDHLSDDQLVALRRKIEFEHQNDRVLFACPECYGALFLSCRKLIKTEGHSYFFKHRPSSKSKECSFHTQEIGLNRSEINRRAYQFRKESPQHLLLKTLIGTVVTKFHDINADIDCKFIVDPETRQRRKPDVRFTAKNDQYALEFQLFSTYLDVVIGRETFYTNHSTALTWIFDKFDPHSDNLITVKEIVSAHNGNAFVFDEKSHEVSLKREELTLWVFYKVFFIVGFELRCEWRKRLIPFLSLFKDEKSLRLFYYNSIKREKQGLRIIEGKREKLKKTREQELRRKQEEERQKRHSEIITGLRKSLNSFYSSDDIKDCFEILNDIKLAQEHDDLSPINLEINLNKKLASGKTLTQELVSGIQKHSNFFAFLLCQDTLRFTPFDEHSEMDVIKLAAKDKTAFSLIAQALALNGFTFDIDVLEELNTSIQNTAMNYNVFRKCKAINSLAYKLKATEKLNFMYHSHFLWLIECAKRNQKIYFKPEDKMSQIALITSAKSFSYAEFLNAAFIEYSSYGQLLGKNIQVSLTQRTEFSQSQIGSHLYDTVKSLYPEVLNTLLELRE